MLASPAHLYMPHLFTHCLPTIMCYVDVYCVFLFMLYATFLYDSILACLCTCFLFRNFYFILNFLHQMKIW